LALGILYTWSVISKGVPDDWGWSQADKSWPYAVACLVFCLVMVPAGQMQDKLGPRLVATIGGTLVGLGMAFLVVVSGLAQVLKAPPAGHVPAGTPAPPASGGAKQKENYLPREMLRTWQFYVLWFMYACGAGAGLMIISKLAEIATAQAGLELGFVLVAVLAIGNGAGRIVAGVASDKIGRRATMLICFALQTVLILLLSQATEGSLLANAAVLAVVSALIGANYGANLSLFPSVTKDYYGLENLGMNYGLVFTAWGFGGFTLALLAGKVYDATESFNFAYYCSVALLALAAVTTFFVRPPHHVVEEPAA